MDVNEKLRFLKKKLMNREQKIERLIELIEINSTIVASLDRNELMNRILAQTKSLMDCQHSSVLLVDEDLKQLYFAAVSDEEEKEKVSGVRLNMGEGIAGTVWGKGKPIVMNNAASDPRHTKTVDKTTENTTLSIIAVPLVMNGHIIGVMEAINKNDNRAFDRLDLEIFQYLSVQVAIAIDNASLYQMVITDSKTKLYANRYFALKLNEEFQRAVRYSSNLSLVIFDIDHFKKFNDSYGHQTGDRVLIRTAAAIKQCCRTQDIPSRFGGEEFVVILPQTDAQGGYEYAERVRKSIENMEILYEKQSIHLTISGGIVSYPAHPCDSGEELLKCSDEALYVSKESGRNRNTIYKNL